MRVKKHHARKQPILFVTLCIGLGLFFVSQLPQSVAAAQQTPQAPQIPQTAAPDLPAGPGKDLLVKTCTKCHTTANIVGKRRDADGWTAVMTQMVGFGAQASDEDLGTIYDYLVKNYGPLNGPPGPAEINVIRKSAIDITPHLH